MNIVAFENNGIAMKETCWIEGKPYFNSRVIGEWLEYSDPQKTIHRIVERNPHIMEHAKRMKITCADGKRHKTLVYDLSAVQLIVFESQQPKSTLFKATFAHMNWDLMNGNDASIQLVAKGDWLAAARQILSLPQGKIRAELIRNLAEREEVSVSTAYRRISQATGERLQTTKGRPINRRTKGTSLYPEEKWQVLAYAQKHPEARGRLIKTSLRLQASETRINCWIRENKINTKPNRQQAGK